MPHRILIVDDELHIICIVQRKLESSGFTVATARNGQEGLEQAQEFGPDLIVSDFQMPGVDGYEMAARLKDNPATAEIPIVMLTARGHKLSPSELARTNIQLLLAKPFSARELVAHVQEMTQAIPTPSAGREHG